VPWSHNRLRRSFNSLLLLSSADGINGDTQTASCVIPTGDGKFGHPLALEPEVGWARTKRLRSHESWAIGVTNPERLQRTRLREKKLAGKRFRLGEAIGFGNGASS